MLRNHLSIAWRSLTRKRAGSVINLAGLTVGIGCVLLSILYIRDELAYDRFFRDADRIFQVNVDGNFAGAAFVSATSPPPAGAELVRSFPQVETATRLYQPGDEVVRYTGGPTPLHFMEKGVMGVDSNFLRVFDYRLVAGDAATCLGQANAVVLTRQVARKYFGAGEALGKTLLFGDDRRPFTVTGVLADVPAQSTFRFDMLRPMASYPLVKHFNWSWVWLQVSTYVRLREDVARDPQAVQTLEDSFRPWVRQVAAPAFRRIDQPFDEFEKKGGHWTLRLQRLTDVHLHSAGIGTRFTTISDIKYVYTFAVVAVFIIVLACVNFMNLATAQAMGRAREVGVRKVLGSDRGTLIGQFLTEALLHSFLAAGLALGLTVAVLPPFNGLAEKSFSATALLEPAMLLTLLGLAVVTGLLAGSYPAFYLTSFRPVNVLKGNVLVGGRGSLAIRNGLVVFQFAVSTALIFCTLVVLDQLEYTRHKDLGLDQENVLVVNNTYRLGKTRETWRNELAALPGVAAASVATGHPTNTNFTDFYVPAPQGPEAVAKDIALSSFIVDEHFVPALGLRLVRGRNFRPGQADARSVILNETAARQIGWKNPLGATMTYPGGNNEQFEVIGIVKDFNVQSLHTPVEPFALFSAASSDDNYDIGVAYTLVKTRAGQLPRTLRAIEAKWKAFAPDVPFDYNFLQEDFAALYRADQRMSTVFNLFTGLAIFVACLGLSGLAAYTAERRTKEIGVRKVLGASVQSIVALLSRDFLRLVLVAALLAFPLAWWYMNHWLESFAYRISISAWVFVAAGAAALLIAQLTVSVQAVRAALTNPAQSLRTE